jgi:glycosyltransferase involved in cell wall biosynthesis
LLERRSSIVSQPELSVVVPAVNTLDDLMDALSALEAQREDVDLEIIVVDRLGAYVRHTVAREFPHARVLRAARGATIPQMRAQAIRAATAPWIAVIEDHVMTPPGWARAMLDAADEDHPVVAGSVDNAANESLLDQACFLTEYSAALPPLPSGPSEGLVGNNVVYSAALLRKHDAVLDEGRWENYLHDAFKQDGVVLECRPEICVGHKKHYSFMEYFTQRYLYSRAYAGMRASGAPRAKRLLLGAAALALPPLLFVRTVRNVLSKGGHTGTLIKSLPLIAVFCCAWGVGEAVGSWFGDGDALAQVC